MIRSEIAIINRLKKIKIQNLSIFVGLLVLCGILGVLSPVFLSVSNISNIFQQTSINAIVAIGMTFVIISSGIDLSVGSILAFCGATVALLLHANVNVFVAILISLVAGALLGFINGFVITKGKVPPFIATLGMMSIARGLTLILCGGMTISSFPKTFTFIGGGNIFGVYIPVIIMFIIYIIAFIILKYTKMGRHTYAIGGNQEAAVFSGINVNKVKTYLYIFSGITAAIAAVIVTGKLNSAQPTSGTGFELDAIAAAVIGGTSLSGGEGSVVGTLIGAIIISVLRNGLILLSVSSYIQQVVIGLVIIVAVFADSNKK